MTDGGKLQASWRRIAEEGQSLVPWQAEHRIPWDDPELSRRFLNVHLDQGTHMASRTCAVIEQHLDWLLELCSEGSTEGTSLRVLDLTCGPGLYCHELARRGHTAFGIDFSPAAIDYAQGIADQQKLDCRFWRHDIFDRSAYDGQALRDLDVITIWFGEFNAFPPSLTPDLLKQCAKMLKPAGLMVIEYQPEDIFLREDAQEWRAVESSVFSDRPHLWLQDYRWDQDTRSEMTVHWILNTLDGDLARYVQCHRAWSEMELVELLHEAGLATPAFLPPITGCDEHFEFSMVVAGMPD